MNAAWWHERAPDEQADWPDRAPGPPQLETDLPKRVSVPVARAGVARCYVARERELEAEARFVGASVSMRQYVRRWINEWDLKRLDPNYRARTIVADLAMDYSEDPDLEVPNEDKG